ncbi:hypothetical protein EHI8A_076990 [Entamoeba histolytica HM-1:IMSS-B]|uniref:Uncharacterized protein n=5 Tax=Entamoeba histolytica TaxID=5759 RepID=A0A175JII0_ENTHI|nr:Hypothetical protein EHI5A_114810 [Entamoeba histolytica KU27]EMH77324.1 hypothetical protein EHI8A_076990 [Entamoeba histolytica HM-1:IMSS-B]EMS13069.1 hypothetical protein KM1_135640 [Entamoeba histolytica HM-3:IMSS]ENY64961.1 hypothetical protein EHI7A_074640 [Entamoeba histolytica HM-1:IMSS-A]GAT93276.1 hypothetical protein CL6EHI_159310 [Entamoeba histolytica]
MSYSDILQGNVSWWKGHKMDIAYIYNCFSGDNGSTAYFTVAGISFTIFLFICSLVDFLNSLSVCLVYISLFLIVLHLDIVVESKKLPWKGKVKHVQYTRFKKSVLEPIKHFREMIYEKIGILSKDVPKVMIFYCMLFTGILIVTILTIIPVKFFSFCLLIGLLTIPQALRNYVEQDVNSAETFRKFVKKQLKEKGLYVTDQELIESMKNNKQITPDLVKKKCEAKKFKKSLKRLSVQKDVIVSLGNKLDDNQKQIVDEALKESVKEVEKGYTPEEFEEVNEKKYQRPKGKVKFD